MYIWTILIGERFLYVFLYGLILALFSVSHTHSHTPRLLKLHSSHRRVHLSKGLYCKGLGVVLVRP